MRILIVDDEPGIRDICQRALRREGHEVAACASGAEALPRLAEPWDLIVSDVSMPGGIDGNELLRRARASGSADVALMTGYASLESSISAVRDGACDYLLKPFNLQALLDLVRRRQNGRRAQAPPPIEPRRLRDATVLFADIRGFTAFSQSAPPDEVATRLDELLACVIEAVHAEGGTVNKLIGDGAMAVFGDPLPHEDPVGGAARAALRARQAAARLGGLRFGFGINTGLVAAGRLGTGESAEYGVIGATVNIAARLEESAGPGQILVGELSAAQLEGRFAFSAGRALTVKGIHGPVTARELLGELASGA
jgi:adenylate cyclase